MRAVEAFLARWCDGELAQTARGVRAVPGKRLRAGLVLAAPATRCAR